MEYKSSDVLNYTDLNNIKTMIENIQDSIYNELGKVAFEIETDKVWQLNDIVYKSEFVKFLRDTQNFKDYYINYINFKDLKKYYNWNTINYEEINDLLNNLNLIDVNAIVNKNIWDFNYLLIWNEDSNIEWEE